MDLSRINTIFFDVDGVFTDGSLYVSDNGINITKFNVHDGMACILLKEIGVDILILTARHSEAVVKRFKDLGIDKIFTEVLKKEYAQGVALFLFIFLVLYPSENNS